MTETTYKESLSTSSHFPHYTNHKDVGGDKDVPISLLRPWKRWSKYVKQSCFMYYLQGRGVNMEVRKPCSGQGLGWDNFPKCCHGLTLIELLITLSIASILVANVFPNISTLIAQERSTVLTNTLTGALAYARSEAVTKNLTVVTCQSIDGSQCHRSENWHNGWIIFFDKNSNKQRDPEEALLRVYPAVNNGTYATFRGSAGIRHYMKYKPTGQAFPNGSFLICNPNRGVGKALIMTRSGRLRLSNVQTNGSAITC